MGSIIESKGEEFRFVLKQPIGKGPGNERFLKIWVLSIKIYENMSKISDTCIKLGNSISGVKMGLYFKPVLYTGPWQDMG